MQKTPEELYEERTKRVLDVVQLKVPDRVPFMPFFHFFHAKYGGITCQEAMYDYDKLAMVAKKTLMDFEPDMYNNPFALVALGPILETLDCKYLTWPGGGLPPHQSYQFVEKEYVTAAEYDDLLFDPTGFMLRQFLPRVYGALEPLQQLPPLPSMYYTRFVTRTAAFASPEVAGALDALVKAGTEARRMLAKAKAFTDEMTTLGFPSQIGGVAYAPFDYIGDLLRGTRGIMLDMYRIPDKLLEAMGKLIPFILQGAIPAAKMTGIPFIFMPMHKGLDGFMSSDQFKTFFWPPLKRVILSLIQEGLIPMVFWEGDCTSRLETIKDIPQGKAIYWFERTDIFKAKEILGDTVCIRGNVPGALLCVGSPGDVEAYCKRLIDVVGKGGGFILDGAIGIPDEAKPENVKAMADTTKEYGVYR
ncbi:MAG TPA: uroporphyrinogen decarboxylase family protein [Desulfatiglandales bacterium]|nr:uroporphyrinogen decarboxylase family protein [Desulfatiglandales bacterium]